MSYLDFICNHPVICLQAHIDHITQISFVKYRANKSTERETASLVVFISTLSVVFIS